ncbi:AAA family ATPase [Vibrio crassostreae]|uniref:AAA family ATPase n=1 Tax=Vibrio TaxID=662 RepID=UPI0009894A4A|nr:MULTISPECIES: AAA family ATPase [Vibrio]QPK04837.1 AAA family ATPase [Vibrio kanaloae]TCW02596.1 AAA ATPase-like protein [Vibrio crassostreae]CAK3276024.1 AAA family ATPase [Vibrio crassostreae]CAK3579321.1 AAA family ATPase [Vibrio crassostreae]CAK3972657.1 AAA family ATPase [Vibrio crassostreae]
MIKNLYIENYKSFKKEHFTFPNLTFFVGANSCGKSSITNLLLLLSQSLDSSFDFDTILRLNGKNIGFGDDLNIVKDHDVDNKVTISWSIEESSDEYPSWSTEDIIDDFYHSFLYNHSVIRRLYGKDKHSDYSEKSNALLSDAESQYYKNFEDRYTSNLLSILKSQQVLITKINKDEIPTNTKGQFRKYSSARLKDLLQYISQRDHLKMHPLSLKLVLRYNSNTSEVEVEKHSILNRFGSEVISFTFNPTGKVDVTSDVIDNELLQKSRRDIIKGINKNSILLSNASSRFTDIRNNNNPFAAYCLSYVTQATRILCKQLIDDKIYHVSPLRALPQRYYLLEKSAHHKTINSYNGTEVTEVLKNNPQILKSVNEFFSEFNISILPVKIRDVIHKITIKQDGISVDLTDVGFGISQVLPILVQLFLCEEESTIIIEQPEIHLHPNMQAILATLLARISIKHNKKLIIETHSEAMIRRLQRLYLDPEFELNNDNVRVYQFTRNSDGGSEAQCDTLGPLGDIKWIKGFKDIEIEDTIEIQKLRSLKFSRGNNIE